MPYDIIVGRTKSDEKKFGDRGTILLGKSYVKMGTTVSMSNRILMDVARSHVVLVAGKRGSGKCLLGGTLIQLDNGEQVPIQDLANNENNIMGLDNKLKIKSLEKNDFFEREVDKILYLKLRSGKEIKLTPEHPLLTVKGWFPAEELTLGGRIATPRKIETFGNEVMEDYKIKILSYLIAEGHTRKSWVLFSNSDKMILNDFKNSVKKIDNNLQVELHSKSGCYRVANKNNRYSFKKNPIKSWLKSLNCYGYYAKEKWIPQKIFKLKKENLALFLNRLFSCDGSIYKNLRRNGWEIDYSSSSKKLIYQVHSLLLKFGILSKVRNKKIRYKGKLVGSYELVLNPENTIKFIQKIGFYGKKVKKQEECLKEIITITRNPNIDTIPKEIWDYYRPSNWSDIGRAVGYKHPKAMRERIRYSPSRQMLLQIAKTDNNEQMKLLAQSDIFWDEIVEMKILEGKFKVYDISVPKFHNFIANDIIVHNSYSLSVMAEEMARLPHDIKKNLSMLFFDTMGIFWTMKYPNERDADLLEKWHLEPEGFDVDLYVPQGSFDDYQERGLPVNNSFTIKTSELSSTDWCDVFGVDVIEPIGILIDRIVGDLKEEGDYDIIDIIRRIKVDKRSTKEVKDAVENRFLAAKKWGLFSIRGTKVSELINPGKITILDISAYREERVKGLVVGLLSKKILSERVVSRKAEELEAIEEGSKYFGEEEVQEAPLVWLFIDEGHIFLPKEGNNPAKIPLIHLLREGRQPGISMVIATQQPGEIARDVMTQSDIIFSHRVTAKADIEALNAIMQTYLLSDVKGYLNNLPKLKGSAIILDDNSERIYPMRVRPKISWHGGETPTSIKVKKKAELELL